MDVFNKERMNIACISCIFVFLFTFIFCTNIVRITNNPEQTDDITRTIGNVDHLNVDVNVTMDTNYDLPLHTPSAPLQACTPSERQEYFRAHYCQNTTLKNSENRLVLVNDKLKVGYCYIAKSASSTLKTMMALSARKGSRQKVLNNKWQMHYKAVLQSFGLRLVPVSSFRHYDTYKKIVAFRHPFTRLVSAYNDKMCTNGHYNKYLKDIRKYLKQRNKPRQYSDWRVAFEEFVDYIISGHMDLHWRPYRDFCDLCHIHYDSVIRLEMFSHDIPAVLDMLGLDAATLDSFSRNRKRSNSTVSSVKQKQAVVHSSVLKEYRNISSSIMEDLKRIYMDDFINFGYDFDSNTGRTSCQINTGSNICC